MRPLPLLVALALTLPGLAQAQSPTPPRVGLQQAFAAMQAGPEIPPEWAGIWQITDSTFSCVGMFFPPPTVELDTLCAGIPITEQDPSGMNDLVCSGTATANEVHVICTGSYEVFADCQETVTITIDGVRTGESYAATSVVNVVRQGTGLGCVSSFCFETRTTGMRIAAEPTAYCATQNESTTWGRVKVLYR